MSQRRGYERVNKRGETYLHASGSTPLTPVTLMRWKKNGVSDSDIEVQYSSIQFRLPRTFSLLQLISPISPYHALSPVIYIRTSARHLSSHPFIHPFIHPFNSIPTLLQEPLSRELGYVVLYIRERLTKSNLNIIYIYIYYSL